MRNLLMSLSCILPLFLILLLDLFQNIQDFLVRLESSLEIHVPALNFSEDVESFYLPGTSLFEFLEELVQSVCGFWELASFHLVSVVQQLQVPPILL